MIVASGRCWLSRMCAAGRSLRVAEVGRVVDVCSGAIVTGN